MAVAVIVFTGCGKDEDPAPSLSGTVWSKTTDDGATTVLTFESSVDCKVVTTFDDSPLAIIVEYSYEYEHPVVMAYPKIDDDLATLKGLISGNTMNVINTSTEEHIATLTKQ